MFLQALHIPKCEQLFCVTLRILEHEFVSGAISFLTVLEKFCLGGFYLNSCLDSFFCHVILPTSPLKIYLMTGLTIITS